MKHVWHEMSDELRCSENSNNDIFYVRLHVRKCFGCNTKLIVFNENMNDSIMKSEVYEECEMQIVKSVLEE